jgi:hypothetical protein
MHHARVSSLRALEIVQCILKRLSSAVTSIRIVHLVAGYHTILSALYACVSQLARAHLVLPAIVSGLSRQHPGCTHGILNTVISCCLKYRLFSSSINTKLR